MLAVSETDRRPVWLLDVDGVLNANKPGWGAAPHRRTVYFADREPVRLRWATALIDRIFALHKSGMVEIRWATSWCPYVDELSQLLKLPAFPPVLAADECGDEDVSIPAKRRVADLVVWEERRPLIWTDDDAIPADGTPERDRLTAGPPVLLITPKENRGLQPVDLDLIEEFCRQVTGAGPG